jgi:uncharacterized membrane protein
LRKNKISQKPPSNETRLLIICGDSTEEFYTSKVSLKMRTVRKVMGTMKEVTIMMTFMFDNLHLHTKKNIYTTVIDIVPTLSRSTYYKPL